jgi:hypothetical protein
MDDELAILSVPTPAGKSVLRVPPSNTEFVYAAGRAMSFWPTVNGNNATWLEAEISKLYANNDDPNLTFKGKLVNIDHTVGTGRKSIVIGVTTQEKYIPGVGVDVLNQLDRRLLEEHDIEAADFKTDGDYSKQSVEINVDRSLSKYIVMINPNSTRLEDQKIFSAEEAANNGIRRTSPSDAEPYMYDGRYKVVEACVPRRIRGIAMLSNPADTTANVYDVAAAKDAPYGDVDYADDGYQADGKKRYPLDTPEHVTAAARFFGETKNRDKYTTQQRDHIDAKIDAAKKRHNIGNEDAGVKTAPTDTYEDSSALDNAYGKVSPMSCSNEDTDGLDDGGFAVVQGGEELAATAKPSVRVRSHPLYESNKHYYSGIPHKGLIKAALDGIGPDKDGKRPYKQDVHSEALRRVRSAHQQLTGDYSMSLPAEEVAKIADPLRADIARLQAEIASHGTESASLTERDRLKDEQIALKDSEIASLKEKIVGLEKANDEQAADTLAASRLVELAKVEGFAVKDDEKAALIAELKDLSDDQFKNRLLKEENASLARKLAAGGKLATDEKVDEHAALKALSGADVKISPNSPYLALYK